MRNTEKEQASLFREIKHSMCRPIFDINNITTRHLFFWALPFIVNHSFVGVEPVHLKTVPHLLPNENLLFTFGFGFSACCSVASHLEERKCIACRETGCFDVRTIEILILLLFFSMFENNLSRNTWDQTHFLSSMKECFTTSICLGSFSITSQVITFIFSVFLHQKCDFIQWIFFMEYLFGVIHFVRICFLRFFWFIPMFLREESYLWWFSLYVLFDGIELFSEFALSYVRSVIPEWKLLIDQFCPEYIAQQHVSSEAPCEMSFYHGILNQIVDLQSLQWNFFRIQ